MNSYDIAERLSGDTEKDIEILSAMMLSERDRDTKRTIIEMLDRVNDYAHLSECGIKPSGFTYFDFVVGDCLFELPDEEVLGALCDARKKADAGDADAQYALAMYLVGGVLGFPDYNEVADLLKKSSEQGNVEATYELGVCYMNGEGVPHSYADANELFKKAADAGSVDAMLALGMAYRGGRGFGEDLKAAFEYFGKAAQKGSAEGYLHLGICTFNGSGTEADIEKAIEYVKKAEALGSTDAKMLLKRMQRYYEEGDLDADEIAARN